MTLTPKIAFIKAGWHSDIVDQAYKGFLEQLEADKAGYEVTSYTVPGAFEMPLLAKRLAQKGYDAVVAAALVVDGGIYRHDFVASAVVDGLMSAQLETDVPMFSVSLTPHHFHANAEHVEFYTGHFVQKGAEAAEAVQQVLSLEL
ncbi:MAG TPA: 6,7-dimethyl-8-ribityllumazine synthase [Octadecabacter sp.]|nr:6,7-dimethyl-8-ribityllumazine synthase [Octadecabacter sp.]